MIAGLRGILEQAQDSAVVVNVGGISYQAFVPASTFRRLAPIGGEVHLHTYLHVRQDTMALYGFATAQEREAFGQLVSVSGVGPKAALAILSALTPDNLREAIAAGNLDALTSIPGIGKKMASRLILELKGKLALPPPSARAPLSPLDAEVMAALTNLGYSSDQARAALGSLPTDRLLDTEERIRLALRFLSAS